MTIDDPNLVDPPDPEELEVFLAKEALRRGLVPEQEERGDTDGGDD